MDARSLEFDQNGASGPKTAPRMIAEARGRGQSIFATRAPELVRGGYSPIPRIIRDGKAKPGIRGWSDLCLRQPTEAEIRNWARISAADVALATGLNGLLGVDLDTDHPEIKAAVRRALPHCNVGRFGSKGFALLCRHADRPQRSSAIYSADETHKAPLVEIMALGRNITIPPSISARTGRPYQWIDPGSGEISNNGLPPIDKLPVVTDDDLRRLHEEVTPWARKPREPRRRLESQYGQPGDKRIVAYAWKALEKIAADVSMTVSGRNIALFNGVCSIGWAVHHGVISEQDLCDTLFIACEHNGLLRDDGRLACVATIRSGLNKAADDGVPTLERRPLNGTTDALGELNGRHCHRDEGGNKSSRSSESSSLPHRENFEIRPEPLPLIRPLPPAPNYPVEALGELIGSAATALHSEIVQCPLPVACNSVLAAAGLVVQAHADVELPTGSVRPLVLNFLSILETGGRKTSTDDHALQAVSEYEAELRKSYDVHNASYQNQYDAWKSERDKIKHSKSLNRQEKRNELDLLGREPEPPAFPSLRYSEPTIEGLITSLVHGYPSVGLFTSEGGEFIGGHAMSDDAKTRTTTTLNKIWDGKPLERIRASEKFILPGRRVSMHLQAQPELAMTMVNDRGLHDNGFFSRFLIVAPISIAGTRFHKPASNESKHALRLYQEQMRRHLKRALPLAQGKGLELAPPALKLTPEAQTRWWQFYDHIEAQVGPDGDLSPIAGLANKLHEHAARIAGVLAVFENRDALEIDKDHLDRAITIAEHYAEEALRLTSAAGVNADLANAKKLLDWLLTKWKEDFIAIKPLVECGPNALRDTRTMRRLVAILVDHHCLEPAPANTVVANKPRREAWKIVRESKAEG